MDAKHWSVPIRPAIAALRDSLIRRISEEGMGRDGVIALWFGEPDAPTPQFIKDAATAALAADHTFYTQNRGVPALRSALSVYASALHERPIAEARLTVTASGMNAIMLVMQLVVEPGDNVVIGTPIWPNCVETVHVMGGAVREVPLVLADGRWRCDMDRLVDAFDERTRAIFINSPGNPTGWVMPAAQQRELLEVCRERRIVIVADEAYERLAYEAPRAPSSLDIAAPDDPVIVVNSFSKSWSMTGWRLGWLTHPADVGDRLAMLNEYNSAAPTTFVQHAGIAALQQGEPFVGELVERYRRNRDLVYQQLAAWPRLRLARPEGAFYAFFAVDGVTDSTALARRILDETAVGLAPGAAFGPAGEGFLRLCFAAGSDTLSQALERLVPVLR